jgi:RimJ/RimL family protein N-acetyltransferase
VTKDALDYSRYVWQGGSVRLRPLGPDDAETAFGDSLDSPSRSALQMGVELPTSVEALRSSLSKWYGCAEADGTVVLAIETLAGEPVGGISLHDVNEKNGVFSFGVSIARKHRRKGYAAEAVRIMLGYGFLGRRFQKCNSACADSNEASIALHRALGFVEEGRVRRHWFYEGRFHDDVMFGMTVEEYLERWPKNAERTGR